MNKILSYKISYCEVNVTIWSEKKCIGRIEHEFGENLGNWRVPRSYYDIWYFYLHNHVNPDIREIHLDCLLEKIEKKFQGKLQKKEQLVFVKGEGFCRKKKKLKKSSLDMKYICTCLEKHIEEDLFYEVAMNFRPKFKIRCDAPSPFERGQIRLKWAYQPFFTLPDLL